jgi:hypothetical protein
MLGKKVALFLAHYSSLRHTAARSVHNTTLSDMQFAYTAAHSVRSMTEGVTCSLWNTAALSVHSMTEGVICTLCYTAAGSVHNMTEGETRLQCRSTHSRLSQPATFSSSVWLQKMVSNILHGCHFDSVNSSHVKNCVPDIFDQPL